MAEVTEEQAADIIRNFTEQKSNLHTFFTNVIKADDTTKTGNLTEEELGMPRLPRRSIGELALFCEKIYNDKGWADYFKDLGEIMTSTSLSKDALLLKLSVTQKKELADVSPKERKKNGGWFKSKRDNNENQQQN